MSGPHGGIFLTHTVQWIRDFLANRTYQTRVGWSMSVIAALMSDTEDLE